MTLYLLGEKFGVRPSVWFPDLSPLAALSLDFHCFDVGTRDSKKANDLSSKTGSGMMRLPNLAAPRRRRP